MDLIGSYHVKPFPPSRLGIRDALAIAGKKPYVGAFLEIDITDCRQRIKAYRAQHHRSLALLTYITKCISLALEHHPELHAIRKGKRKLIQFDHIDVVIQVERMLQNTRTPMPYVIRRTNEKSISVMQQEIEQAQTKPLAPGQISLDDEKNSHLRQIYPILPQWIRRIFWRRFYANPFFQKKISGLVGITSLSSYGSTSAWVLPSPTIPISIALGGIVKKPGVFRGTICIREFLCLTLFMDHDLVDGAPIARFVRELIGLIERDTAQLLDI
jgi:pyruvate/2-oxoglutarate dehydrogenase complex dihydrolipoamide acyltransferase (E2) component